MNLLEWLENYIMENTKVSDSMKARLSTTEYFVELAKRKDKFIRTTNFHVEFSYVTIPNELLILTEEHKQQIKEKFDFYTENFYPSTLWMLTRILADYERSEDLDNPIPIAILKLRNFINELFKQQYPKEYSQIEAELEKARRGHKEKAKIVCIECGSTNIRSWGEHWKCRDCGRKFIKKPRRKHYKK